MSVALSAVPVLNSLPGAPVTVYLDFNGQAAMTWGSYNATATPAYSTDSDVTSFSDQEIANINLIWARAAEKFSPFNVNVTTVDPGSFAAKKAVHVVIGGAGGWTGSVMGGVSYIGGFNKAYAGNVSWVFSNNLGNDPGMVGEAVAHETAHNFGLNHHSSYNGATKTAEYDRGDALRAPIMGNSYSAQRGLWMYAPTNSSSTTMQDDLAVITSATNGITYRADDHSNSLTAGDAFSISGVNVSAGGVITTTADVDSFTFTTGAGLVSFTGNAANSGAMLDLKLSLYNSAGALLQTEDSASLGETLSATLAAGTYTLVVGSHGSYGDIGQFTVSGTIVSTTTPAPTSPTNLAAAVSGKNINLSWSDNASNETGYVIQRSSDAGASFANVVTVGANVSTWSDTAATAGTNYMYRVYATGAGGNSTLSNTASAVVPPIPVAPTSVTVTATTTSSITINWTDIANETAYLIQQSPDGGTSWVQVGSTGANATTFTSTGLQSNKSYMLRVWASNATGTSAPSSAATGTTTSTPTAPVTPSGLAVTAVTSNSISLSWTDVANETSYTIQRSTDNVNFTTIASPTANVTMYVATGLNASTKYYFKIAAGNATGTSNFSASVNSTTTSPLDVTAPTITTKTPTAGAVIAISSTNIDVTFSENVTGVDLNDLVLTGTGATSAIKGTPVLVSGTTWRFPVSNLATGGVNVSIAPTAGNITDTAGNSLANVTWSFNVSLPAAVMFSAKINFQDTKSAGMSGHLADTGAIYGARGNGYTYGWNADNSANTRNRNATTSPDERYDTLNQMQRGGNFTWDIAVPNGTYSVRLVAGDPSYTDSVYKLNVENTLAISGTPNATTKFFDNTVQVTVTDGKLSVTNATGASNNKICFIEITQIS